jgi:hypothetical protein
MTPAETFAQEVARRASAALSGTKTRCDTFSIGAARFRLIAPDCAADQSLGSAFPRAPDGPAHSVSDAHQAVVWDGIDQDSLPPERPWSPTAHEPLGVVATYSNEAVRCAFDIHTSSLIIYNFARNTSHTWVPSIRALPAWAKASPLRIIVSWLCNRHGMQIVHGAAVAIDGRAVLLAGAGGSGKSTTALACALAGMDYLGDDYCAVEPAAGKIHMVYRTAKVTSSTIAMLPALEKWIFNRNRLDAEKGVIFFGANGPRLARSAGLAAILLPRVDSGFRSSLRPATRDDAIRAILPSTVGGLMGGTAITPRLIMELVRSVPAYHLALGTDINSAADTIASRLTAG